MLVVMGLMQSAEYERQLRAGAMFTHNLLVVSRPSTLSGTKACQAARSHARDMILHGPAQAILGNELVITEEQYERLRPDAVEILRWGCRVCGACERFGITPP